MRGPDYHTQSKLIDQFILIYAACTCEGHSDRVALGLALECDGRTTASDLE